MMWSFETFSIGIYLHRDLLIWVKYFSSDVACWVLERGNNHCGPNLANTMNGGLVYNVIPVITDPLSIEVSDHLKQFHKFSQSFLVLEIPQVSTLNTVWTPLNMPGQIFIEPLLHIGDVFFPSRNNFLSKFFLEKVSIEFKCALSRNVLF